jgi:AhpD family alkylhydroperoxidase
MKPRLNARDANLPVMQAMMDLEAKLQASGLEKSLYELVKIRASQINGCAYCIHMHTTDARAAGESEERIYLLDAWHEAPCYTDRERAALAWTDALTRVVDSRAPDADYEMMAAQFSAQEQVTLTALIGLINAWNRIAIGFRMMPPVAVRSNATAA